MDEKIFEISFSIISVAGDAKSLAFEAINEAKLGNIDKANEIIQKSKDEMVKAHRFQTELIQKEASGEKTEVGVILIHAQDHLMNAMNFIQLAQEFIDVYDRLENK